MLRAHVLLGEVTQQSTLISLSDFHASSLWSRGLGVKITASEVKLRSSIIAAMALSLMCSRMCAPIFFILVDLSLRMLSGTLSYLSAPGALSVSEQSEQCRLLDTFRSHYFARSTLA